MEDLVVWLRQQLDEDERIARAAGEGDWAAWEHTGEVVAAPLGFGKICQGVWGDLGELGDHIALHDPARVLREVEAKRRRLARHRPIYANDVPGLIQCSVTAELWPCPDLRNDLAVYSDRPGYREEWKQP